MMLYVDQYLDSTDRGIPNMLAPLIFIVKESYAELWATLQDSCTAGGTGDVRQLLQSHADFMMSESVGHVGGHCRSSIGISLTTS